MCKYYEQSLSSSLPHILLLVMYMYEDKLYLIKDHLLQLDLTLDSPYDLSKC